MRHLSPRWLLSLFALFLLLPPWSASAQNATPAIITGRVTLDDGKPAVGQTVIVRSTDYVSPTPSGMAVTDADGRYTVSINTGLFPALFADTQAPNPPPDAHFSVTVRIARKLYLEPVSHSVTLTPGEKTDSADFIVTTGPKVTVRVHDALTRKPVSGVPVYDSQSGTNSMHPMLGVTDTNGVAVFRLTSLHAELTLFPPDDKASPVQIAPGYPGYKEIWLQAAQDVVWDIKTYSNSLPETIPWRGIVLGANGLPVGGVTVHIMRRSGESITQTDNRGHFSSSLPPLNKYEDSGLGTPMVALLAERDEQTALLFPTADETWEGMVLRLASTPLSSITGTVVDAQGHPEAGVPVTCDDTPLMSYDSFSRKADNDGATDATGRFTISRLLAGRYRLTLGGGPFAYKNLPPFFIDDFEQTRPIAAGAKEDLGQIVVPTLH
jgi:hypothetical protein